MTAVANCVMNDDGGRSNIEQKPPAMIHCFRQKINQTLSLFGISEEHKISIYTKKKYARG